MANGIQLLKLSADSSFVAMESFYNHKLNDETVNKATIAPKSNELLLSNLIPIKTEIPIEIDSFAMEMSVKMNFLRLTKNRDHFDFLSIIIHGNWIEEVKWNYWYQLSFDMLDRKVWDAQIRGAFFAPWNWKHKVFHSTFSIRNTLWWWWQCRKCFDISVLIKFGTIFVIVLLAAVLQFFFRLRFFVCPSTVYAYHNFQTLSFILQVWLLNYFHWHVSDIKQVCGTICSANSTTTLPLQNENRRIQNKGHTQHVA